MKNFYLNEDLGRGFSKVLFVCEGFEKETVVAQPWRHIYEIAKRMIPLGYEVKILSDQEKNLPAEETIKGISVRRIEKDLFFFNLDKLKKALNEENADIINWFGGPLSALYFSKMEETHQRKIVWNLYKGKLTYNDLKDIGFGERLSLLKDVQFIYSIVPNYFIKRSLTSSKVDTIIVWSKRLKQYLIKIGVGENKISVVTSGVDTEHFKTINNKVTADFKSRYGIATKDKLVMYFGALSSFRGLPILLSAMNEVFKKNLDAKLIVVAREKNPNTVDKYLKLARKKDRIIAVSGIFSQNEIIKFLSMSELIVLPFKSWPHQEVPLTLLEAMSMGKIVISTTLPQIMEMVENNVTGLLVPPNNSKILAEKIDEVLSNMGSFAKIGETASRYVEGRHNWDNIVKATTDIYSILSHRCNSF